MRGTCPHCGVPIEMVPDIDGSTIVMDAEEIDVALPFPSGYVKTRKGHKVHHCDKTGEKGHVNR